MPLCTLKTYVNFDTKKPPYFSLLNLYTLFCCPDMYLSIRSEIVETIRLIFLLTPGSRNTLFGGQIYYFQLFLNYINALHSLIFNIKLNAFSVLWPKETDCVHITFPDSQAPCSLHVQKYSQGKVLMTSL